MDPVVHFEMPAKDRERMAKFYTGVFGWKAQMLGEDMGNYVTVATTETDEKNMPKRPGAINGGFFPLKDGDPVLHPSVVISVGNLKDSMKKITKAGGKLIGEPMNIPGVGEYISFYDTEGNRCGLLQPSMG
ncbi:MAG: VOC family protein [Bacteroidota bacterium]|nr:VOC family protein [Bacteroidota bacterium]